MIKLMILKHVLARARGTNVLLFYIGLFLSYSSILYRYELCKAFQGLLNAFIVDNLLCSA